MYYKKKKHNKYKKSNYKNIVPLKGKNYIIDSKGQKQFWLRERVPKKLFKVLRFKFNFVHKR